MIIDPANMTVLEWTDAVNYELRGPVPKLTNPDRWVEDWAIPIRQHLPNALMPNPYAYELWLDWANDFNKAVRY